jgi:hypothetical protein
MSPGPHFLPDPHDPPADSRADVPDLPADDQVDAGRIAEDVAQEPEEKHNATDATDGADGTGAGTTPA